MPGQTWGSEPGVDSSHESEITVLTSNWQLKQESNVYVESNKKKKKKKNTEQNGTKTMDTWNILPGAWGERVGVTG